MKNLKRNILILFQCFFASNALVIQDNYFDGIIKIGSCAVQNKNAENIILCKSLFAQSAIKILGNWSFGVGYEGISGITDRFPLDNITYINPTIKSHKVNYTQCSYGAEYLYRCVRCFVQRNIGGYYLIGYSGFHNRDFFIDSPSVNVGLSCGYEKTIIGNSKNLDKKIDKKNRGFIHVGSLDFSIIKDKTDNYFTGLFLNIVSPFNNGMIRVNLGCDFQYFGNMNLVGSAGNPEKDAAKIIEVDIDSYWGLRGHLSADLGYLMNNTFFVGMSCGVDGNFGFTSPSNITVYEENDTGNLESITPSKSYIERIGRVIDRNRYFINLMMFTNSIYLENQYYNDLSSRDKCIRNLCRMNLGGAGIFSSGAENIIKGIAGDLSVDFVLKRRVFITLLGEFIVAVADEYAMPADIMQNNNNKTAGIGYKSIRFSASLGRYHLFLSEDGILSSKFCDNFSFNRISKALFVEAVISGFGKRQDSIKSGEDFSLLENNSIRLNDYDVKYLNFGAEISMQAPSRFVNILAVIRLGASLGINKENIYEFVKLNTALNNDLWTDVFLTTKNMPSPMGSFLLNASYIARDRLSLGMYIKMHINGAREEAINDSDDILQSTGVGSKIPPLPFVNFPPLDQLIISIGINVAICA